jgi:hypothetical protein
MEDQKQKQTSAYQAEVSALAQKRLVTLFLIFSLLPAFAVAVATLLISRYGFFGNTASNNALEDGFRVVTIIAGVALLVAIMSDTEKIPLPAMVTSALLGAWAIFSEEHRAFFIGAGIMLFLAFITVHFLNDRGHVPPFKIYLFALATIVCSFIANVAVALVWQGHF